MSNFVARVINSSVKIVYCWNKLFRPIIAKNKNILKERYARARSVIVYKIINIAQSVSGLFVIYICLYIH